MSGSGSGGGKSGGGRSGGGAGGRRGGWEEAGAEFYQESYPGAGLEVDVPTSKAANIATMLPSKQHRGTTVRRIRPIGERRQSTAARGTTTGDTMVSMLPDLSENLSNEESTWEEIMQIKAMPVPMMQKRQLKMQLQNATKLRLQGLEQLQWRRRKAWQGTTARFRETLSRLELWKQSFKTIEGNFGTGVVAYFLLLKWLVMLNLTISTLIILFIIIPSAIFDGIIDDEVCDMVSSPNSTQCCSENYFNTTIDDGNPVLDIVQGTGWMEKTYLFYGMYSHKVFTYYIGGSNRNASFFQDTTGALMFYDLPLAYILIPVIYFLISLIAIVRSAARGFKERLVEGEGQFYQYCNLVFGGWDFCIHNEKSANIKHKALYNEMKGCLEEERLQEERQGRSREEQIKLVVIRMTVSIVVLGILIASGFAIFYAFNFSLSELNQINPMSSLVMTNDTSLRDLGYPYNINVENSNLNTSDVVNLTKYSQVTKADPNSMAQGLKMLLRTSNDQSYDTLSEIRIFFLQYLPALCIVGLNIFVPTLFKYLITFENYSPRLVVKLTLFRTVLLRLSSLVVLLSQMYLQINLVNNSLSCTDSESSLLCWETYVGQQLYKLLIADFAIQIVMTFFINLPRSFMAKHTSSKCIRMFGEQEFHLPKHVLDVVYSQTLCWLGSFYCPILPIIATVLCFFTFYLKKFTCLVNSKPSSTVYRASRSNSLFMLVLLFSFCTAIVPLGYGIAEITPSRSCGPFRGLSSVWEEVVLTFGKFPDFLRTIVFLIGTSVFAVPAFIVLILLLYYYWAVTDANRHMVTVLKSQLVLEGHDKQFLLNRLSVFIRQQQKRNERARQHHAHTNVDDDESIRHSSK